MNDISTVSIVCPLQGKLGEPTSVFWELKFRFQYRHPPLLRKLEESGEGTHLLRGGFIIVPAGGGVVL